MVALMCVLPHLQGSNCHSARTITASSHFPLILHFGIVAKLGNTAAISKQMITENPCYFIYHELVCGLILLFTLGVIELCVGEIKGKSVL